jgi:O-antigen ligase
MFIDKPLLGHGPKTFRINCQKPMYYENIHSCATHPHNFLLQLLAEVGIFGFFIVFLFFYFLIFYLKKINKKFYSMSFYYLPLIIFTFPFLPNGNFFNNWLSMVSYLSISLSIYLLFIKNEKNKNSARI